MPTIAPIPVFDLHCDTADRLAWQSLDASLKETVGQQYYGPHDEDAPADCRDLAHNHCHISLEMIGATPWAQCFACFVPDQLSPEQAARFYDQVMGYLTEQVAQNAGAVTLVGGSAEIRGAILGNQAGRAGKGAGPSGESAIGAGQEPAATPHLVAVRTIENARMFAADLGLVERYANAGLLMASLSWNAAGPLASGHDTHEGLTSAGRDALAEMERLGVVLDVSHLNDECFADVARLSARPFVASHSNSRAVCGHPRNLTDAQFAEIRDRGGVVGLNFCSSFLVEGAHGERGAAVTFDEVAAHVEHWLDLGGEDALALGSDYDGTSTPAFLNGADTIPAFQGLLAERFGEGITRKLCYENALAFFERNGR